MTLKRALVTACVMVVPTVPLFGPVHAFHHNIFFGMFGYMLWDGEGWPSEDPVVGNITWGDETFHVLISPQQLAITFAVWLAILVGVIIFPHLAGPVSREPRNELFGDR